MGSLPLAPAKPLILWVWLFKIPHISRITQYLFFCNWLTASVNLGRCNKCDRPLFLTDLEAKRTRTRIKVLGDSVRGESPFPGLQMDTFLLCAHTAEKEKSVCLSYNGTNPRYGGFILVIASQSPHLQIPSHWELWLPQMNQGGRTRGTFSLALTSLRIMSSRVTQVVAYYRVSFFFRGWVIRHCGLPWRLSRKESALPVQEMWVWSLGQEDPLEDEMATYSSILAWEIPWTEESGGLQSMGLQRVRHDSAA